MWIAPFPPAYSTVFLLILLIVKYFIYVKTFGVIFVFLPFGSFVIAINSDIVVRRPPRSRGGRRRIRSISFSDRIGLVRFFAAPSSSTLLTSTHKLLRGVTYAAHVCAIITVSESAKRPETFLRRSYRYMKIKNVFDPLHAALLRVCCKIHVQGRFSVSSKRPSGAPTHPSPPYRYALRVQGVRAAGRVRPAKPARAKALELSV